MKDRAKPNILIFMVDQLNGTLFPEGPATWLHTPHLDKIAQHAQRFSRCYTASPLCAPGRASFMSGRLPSKTGVYDNAAEFKSSIPTFAHMLRMNGYHTCLSGKMHFVGPDQLHGFEQRLTTDIYPADFGWTPDYRKPDQRIDWWYHNMGSVTGSGIAEISNQLEYDDEVANFAATKLYDLARIPGHQPWCLTVSFTHPHDPYLARKHYWDLYATCPALEPRVQAMDFDHHDPHSQRIFKANDWLSYDVGTEDIIRSRRAYFANISYIDDQIGRLMQILESTGQQDNTIIMFCSDHGDMLGERGLWFKMSFFEGSARVPLLICHPHMQGKTIDHAVSNLDIFPTLADLLNINITDLQPWLDGTSLVPMMHSDQSQHPVRMEYMAEASIAPMVCLVDRGYKYVQCTTDPTLLFDLEKDPDEQVNLAAAENHHDILSAFKRQAENLWNLSDIDQQVRDSQAQRLLVYEALRNGEYFPWDFQPLQAASERFMRNHMDLNELEANKRYPKSDV